jgi:DNA processing protein
MHKQLQASADFQIQSIAQGSPLYPKRLLDLSDPPKRIFYIGDIGLLTQPMLAVVGARKASPSGLLLAHHFSSTLGLAGYHIISGMAYGIDSAAHRSILDIGAGCKTIAVCGNGLDRTYPPEHRELATRIAARGLLLSEYPPGTGPKSFHFPKRNRIIAALSLGVVVIEAAQKSGSLITAYLASSLGREVFVLPGPITSPLFEGSNQLIQEGAKLVRGVQDVLEELPNIRPH